MLSILGVICLGCAMQVCLSESELLRGPPKVEKNPKFSNSYIPAAMQIIAHSTELMKYVIKPPQGTTTTTTTLRPTPPHGPGVFAPTKPLGPTTYFSPSNLHAQFVQNQQQPSGLNYFNRYPSYLSLHDFEGRTFQDVNENIYDEAEKYLGKNFGDVLRLANRIEPGYVSRDPDDQLQDFSKKFEDSESSYRFTILSQKKVPPTKAYVTMLSLYDLLNKESKRLMLNKYAGYTDEVLHNLVEFSSSTSSYQLRSILNKLVENDKKIKEDILKKVKDLIADLDKEGSYINDALKNIPPLAFTH